MILYYKMDNKTRELTEVYIKTLTEKEYKSYQIAKSHLGTSFQIEKSVGFLQWKKENETNL